MVEKRVLLARAQPVKAPEAPGVVIAKTATVIEQYVDVVMEHRRGRCRENAKTARHPQVHHQDTVISFE